MTIYPFVQARYDFGVRKGPTLALMLHGAEAEAGVVGYLSRAPSRNVSANFVCERSGRMVRMLAWDHASGSMNPQDRSTNKAYYGRTHLVDVLGSWWDDPNSAVISVEGEWYARTGPNAAQVAALIAWGADMRTRFPTVRGALGHADQTDTKGCPGSTAAMKAIFSGLGGHGLWPDEDPMSIYTRTLESGRFLIKAGASVRGWKPAATGWDVVKTLTASDDTSGPYVARLARKSGSASPSSLIEVPLTNGGFFAGLYISTAEVEEIPDPAPPPPPPPVVPTPLGPGLYEVT